MKRISLGHKYFMNLKTWWSSFAAFIITEPENLTINYVLKPVFMTSRQQTGGLESYRTMLS